MIKGVSDIRRFPRAGKIHLGVKATNQKGKEYPRAVDYFVLPEDRPDLAERFGAQPRELPIMFPVDDLETVAPQWYKRYGSGTGLVCRGDGETAVCRAMQPDKETGEMKPTGEFEEIECSGQECEWYIKKHCRHVMNLQFLLPDFISDGVWQLDTSSFFSIVNFNGSWDFIRTLTGGKVAMIPLLLRVVPKEVAPGGSKKIVHVLELKLAGSYSLDQLQALSAGTSPAPAALPEPDCSSETEHFYPPEVREELPDTPDEVVGALRADMEPDQLDLDIISLFDELDLTEGQRAAARRKYPDREELLQRLTTERDGKKVIPMRPAPPKPSEPTEATSSESAHSDPDSPIAQPAAPSCPRKSYF